MSTMTDSAIQTLFSHWQSSDYKAGIAVSGVAGLLIMISAALVYTTGGTQHSYVHVVYVPILIGAFFFGPLGGFLTGLLSGLVMGPMMPLDATLGTNQDPLNYLSRTAAFSMIGAVAGVMFVTIGRYLKIMRSQAFADPVTGLPNRAKLLADVSDLQRHLAAAPTKDDTLQPTQILTIRVEPYSRVMATLGHDCADAMLRSVVGRLESKADGAWKFYDLREGVLAVIIWTPSTDDAVKYVYRLSGALREPVSAKGIPILAECRFGVASLNPGSGSYEIHTSCANPHFSPASAGSGDLQVMKAKLLALQRWSRGLVARCWRYSGRCGFIVVEGEGWIVRRAPSAT